MALGWELKEKRLSSLTLGSENHALVPRVLQHETTWALAFPVGLVGSQAKEFFVPFEDLDQQISDALFPANWLRLIKPYWFLLNGDLLLVERCRLLP